MNEMLNNRPIGGDFEKNNGQNNQSAYDRDDEIFEFKSVLEELNRELEDELEDNQ